MKEIAQLENKNLKEENERLTKENQSLKVSTEAQT